MSDAPKRVQWELADAGWGDLGRDRVKWLLREGWQPFAIAGMSIWFRRIKAPTNADPR